MERFQTVTGVAGLCFFVFSVVAMGIGSISARGLATMSIEEHGKTVIPEFVQLEKSYPKQFKAAYGAAYKGDSIDFTVAFADALREGRNAYVREACWHCHSQFVRPVAAEVLRWGPVATADEGHTELHQPVLYGTRRVGPDLSRENGRRSNDWQLAHLFEPTDVVPSSVMPSFKWMFETTGRFLVVTSRKEEVAKFASQAEAEAEASKRNSEAFSSRQDGGKFKVFDPAGKALPTAYDKVEDADAEAQRRNAVLNDRKPYRTEPERAPNRIGLSVVAYLQWQGSWKPNALADEQAVAEEAKK